MVLCCSTSFPASSVTVIVSLSMIGRREGFLCRSGETGLATGTEAFTETGEPVVDGLVTTIGAPEPAGGTKGTCSKAWPVDRNRSIASQELTASLAVSFGSSISTALTSTPSSSICST